MENTAGAGKKDGQGKGASFPEDRKADPGICSGPGSCSGLGDLYFHDSMHAARMCRPHAGHGEDPGAGVYSVG